MTNLTTVLDIIQSKLGPYDDYDKDNNKLLFGDLKNEIKNVFFCWRLTSNVLKKIKPSKKTLIVCHEPVIVDIKHLLTLSENKQYKSNAEKQTLISATGANIARFHLSLDSSDYGTNQTLVKKLGLNEKKRFKYYSICELPKEQNASEFIKKVKKKLGSEFAQVTGDANRKIKNILVVAGGGASKEFVAFAITSKCDAILSGDSYMESRYLAYENNILLIDPGHQELEVPGVKEFAHMIRSELKSQKIEVEFVENEKIEHIH